MKRKTETPYTNFLQSEIERKLKPLQLGRSKPEKLVLIHDSNRRSTKSKTQIKSTSKPTIPFYSYFTNSLPPQEPYKNLSNELKSLYSTIEDSFVNAHEMKEIFENYQDSSLGDFVINFHNPDLEGLKDKPIRLRDALSIWDKQLFASYNQTEKYEDRPILRKDFINAFLSLEDYEKDNEILSQKRSPSKRIFTSSPKKFKTLKRTKSSSNIEDEDSEDEHIFTRSHTSPKKIVIDKNLDKEILKEYKNVTKKYCGGGFLVKKMIPNTDDYDWICSNNRPKDFLTLIRNVIAFKLSIQCKLHCRQFVTSDGKNIVMVLKTSEEVLKREAARMRLSKELEIGAMDLFSLEPVDQDNRPLRLKEYLFNSKIPKADAELIAEFSVHNGKVEEKAKVIFMKLRNLNEIQFHSLIIAKSRKVNGYFREMVKKQGYSISLRKADIFDDRELSRSTWETYYIYLEYLDNLLGSLNNSKVKLEKEEFKPIKANLDFIYKLVFLKALGDSNEIAFDTNFHSWSFENPKRCVLRNSWDLIGTYPISPHSNYFISEDAKRMWRKYEVDENRHRSIFTNMERIKITNSILMDSLNLFSLMKNQDVIAFFPLHNNYLLRGQKTTPLYKMLSDANFIPKAKKLTKGELKLRKYFERMADEAENTDFDDENSSLEVDTAFSLRSPWSIPIDVMRNYFGEKIALYFDFLSFYTKHLSYMSLIGIIAQLLLNYGSSEIFMNTKITMAVVNVIWCTVFLELWKREQNNFAQRFGQKNVISEDVIRPDFYGTKIRSIIDDNMNEPYYSGMKHRLRIMFTYFLTFVFICIVILAVISTFLLKQYFMKCNCVEDSFFIINTVPSIINSLLIFVFNYSYTIIVFFFNKFENHKTFTSYEDSHSLKTFIFSFVNTFNSLILIAFFDSSFPVLELCKVNSNKNTTPNTTTPSQEIDPDSRFAVENQCFQALSDRMSTIFIITIIKNIPELLTPLILAKIADFTKKKDERPLVHVFMDIDAKIEKQLLLPNYGTVIEVDGTGDDYMEMVMQFSFLCLFSPAFPLAYLLSFVNNVFEIQVDKVKLVRLNRRPVGKSASDLGTWQLLMESVAYIGLFINAGLITFTSRSLPKELVIPGFTMFLLFFLGIKYIISFLIPDESPQAKRVAARHKGILEAFAKNSKHANINLEMVSHKPNYKIENVRNRPTQVSIDSIEENDSDN